MARAKCPGCGGYVPIVHGLFAVHWMTDEVPAPPFLSIIADIELTEFCEGSGLPMRACRQCGCTEEDCTSCVLKTGQPCWWVEDDLCSACAPPAPIRGVQAEMVLVDDAQDFLRGVIEDPDSYNDGPIEWRSEVLGEWVDKDGR